MSDDEKPVIEDAATGAWDLDRVQRAKLEIMQIEAKLKSEAAAQRGNAEKAADFDRAMTGRGARKLIRDQFGFDPGPWWND